MAVRTRSTIGTLCLRVQGREEAVTAAVFRSSFRQQRHSFETSSADKLRYATGENMGTGGLCLQQYNYWPVTAADLSSPTTNHSRLIVNTARQQTMPQTGDIYKSWELHS